MEKQSVKMTILIVFLVLAGAVAVYLVSSLRNVARERIEREDLPHGAYEVTKWVSDADGTAYIMHDTAAQTPVSVSKGFGKTESEGFRPSNAYLEAVPGKVQVFRMMDKKSGQPIAYILASERLEIETGYNILKRSAVISIRDSEDAHHRKMREGYR
jgi:hypothetical protein